MKPIYIAIVAIVLLFSECKKQISSLQLKLTSPVSTSNQNPTNILFTWQSNEVDSSTIVIAKDANFSNVVYKFTTIEKQHLPTTTFQPNKTYYWKVTQSGETVTSSFNINNVLNNLISKNYLAYFYVYSWNMSGSRNNELYYSDTVALIKEGDDIRFIYAKDSIDRVMEFYPYADTINNSLFYKTTNFGSNGCSLSYNYTDNKVAVTNHVGGLGAGRIWEINFKNIK